MHWGMFLLRDVRRLAGHPLQSLKGLRRGSSELHLEERGHPSPKDALSTPGVGGLEEGSQL